MWILVVPESYLGVYGAGQWKDLASLRGILAEAGGPGREFVYNGRNLDELIGLIGLEPVHVVWYYSFHPEELAALRKACPAVFIHVRTVNAESLQHLTRNPPGWLPTRGNMRILYGAARVAWRDSLCRRIADTLPGISASDNRRYWSRLPGRATVVDAPYVTPWPEIRPDIEPRPWAARENLIVCLAGGRDRISLASTIGFFAVVARLRVHPLFRDWTFAISEGLLESGKGPDSAAAGVVNLGRIDEPWDIMCRARAVAVLTPLGYGCKTTLFDAVAAGCHALAHPVLATRLPAIAHGAVLLLDPGIEPDAVTWHAHLSAPPPQPSPHAGLRSVVVEVWRRVLVPAANQVYRSRHDRSSGFAPNFRGRWRLQRRRHHGPLAG